MCYLVWVCGFALVIVLIRCCSLHFAVILFACILFAILLFLFCCLFVFNLGWCLVFSGVCYFVVYVFWFCVWVCVRQTLRFGIGDFLLRCDFLLFGLWLDWICLVGLE